MTKKPVSTLLSICLLFAGCSKVSDSVNNPRKVNTPDSTIKITLVSGDNQTDTIGNPLKSNVIVKVTQNGTPVSGYTVMFQGSGCNEENIISTVSQPDGTIDYIWSLAGDVGQQTLKAVLLDSNNQKADSVTATATAVATTSGWHNSACSVGLGRPLFCKISTGRVFATYIGEKDYLKYSDDNGISWKNIKSLGNTHVINYAIPTSSDELFVFTSDGIFYSNNEAQTWSNLGVPPWINNIIQSATYTPSGKLIVSFSSGFPLSISTDKGKTWTSVTNTAFVPTNNNSPVFGDPAEDNDGNLYVVEHQNENVFKSADKGVTWTVMEEPGVGFPGTDFSFWIDNSTNWFYKGESHFNGGVWISKNKGATYSQLVFYSNTYIADISIQTDGKLYYEDIEHGLYAYDFAAKTASQISKFNFTDYRAYIVAKNNNVIVSNLGSRHTIVYYTK